VWEREEAILLLVEHQRVSVVGRAWGVPVRAVARVAFRPSEARHACNACNVTAIYAFAPHAAFAGQGSRAAVRAEVTLGLHGVGSGIVVGDGVHRVAPSEHVAAVLAVAAAAIDGRSLTGAAVDPYAVCDVAR
jgi:hypothetical protein